MAVNTGKVQSPPLDEADELIALLDTRFSPEKVAAALERLQAEEAVIVGKRRALQSMAKSAAWRSGKQRKSPVATSDAEALSLIRTRLDLGRASVRRIAGECKLTIKQVKRLLAAEYDAEGWLSYPNDEWGRKLGQRMD
jgi:hypothetical protein